MEELRNHLVQLEEDSDEDEIPVPEETLEQATNIEDLNLDDIVNVSVDSVSISDYSDSDDDEDEPLDPHPYDGTVLLRLWPTRKGRILPAVVVHVNYFRVDNGGDEEGAQLIPCEIGLTAFSVQRGILGTYSALLGAVDFPLASSSSTQSTQLDADAVTRGINELPYPTGNRLQVHAIRRFLDKYVPRRLKHTPIFCDSSCISDVKKILEDLYSKTGVEFKHAVLSLEWLMVSLSQSGLRSLARMESVHAKRIVRQITCSLALNLPRRDEGCTITVEDLSGGCNFKTIDLECHLKLGKTSRIAARETTYFPETVLGVFSSESRASAYLKFNKEAYGCRLACRYHDVKKRVGSDGRSVFCAWSISQRKVFLILDAVLVNFGVTPRVGRHYPREDHV